jgi:hypothetical protein
MQETAINGNVKLVSELYIRCSCNSCKWFSNSGREAQDLMSNNNTSFLIMLSANLSLLLLLLSLPLSVRSKHWITGKKIFFIKPLIVNCSSV